MNGTAVTPIAETARGAYLIVLPLVSLPLVSLSVMSGTIQVILFTFTLNVVS